MKPLIVFLLVTITTSAAYGESQRPKRLNARKTASLLRPKDVAQVSSELSRPSRDFIFRLGVASGFAQTNSNQGSAQNSRDRGRYNQNAYVGINANLAAYRYGYVDLDGFYSGTPSAKTVTTVDTIVGRQETSNRKLSTLGGAGEIGGRLPIYSGWWKFVPTAGVGFGYFSVRDDRESGASLLRTNTNVSGPYGSVGLSVMMGQRFSISGDAALSISAKGSVDSSDSTSIISNKESASARFSRIRSGAYYRLSQPLTLGVQYIRRQIRNQATGDSTPATETTNQVLGTMVVHF